MTYLLLSLSLSHGVIAPPCDHTRKLNVNETSTWKLFPNYCNHEGKKTKNNARRGAFSESSSLTAVQTHVPAELLFEASQCLKPLCREAASPTQRGPVLAHDDLHGGDDLLGDRRGHGGGVHGAVGVTPQVVDQLLAEKFVH